MIFYAHEDNIISYVCDWENSLKVCVLYNDFNTFYTQKTLKQNTSLDKFNYYEMRKFYYKTRVYSKQKILFTYHLTIFNKNI